MDRPRSEPKLNERDDVERLRARVAELEAQLSRSAGRPVTDEKAVRRSAWWAAGSAILITLACVLAPLSVAAVWASAQLSDTDQYVETVAPIGDDPAVQDALADRVTTVIFENLDVEGVVTPALETLAAQENVPPRVADALPSLAVPIANGIESFTGDQVDAFFASDAFDTVWDQVNRIAHQQVVTLLEGNEGGAVSAQGDTITLNLGPIVAEVKNRLVDRGLDLANNIPAIETSFVLVQSDAITQAQGLYSLLNTLGAWLPIIALALFVAGVMLARDRRRAVIKGAIGVVAAMVVFGVALALARGWYADATPGDVLSAQAAGNVFDTLVRFLRTAVRALAVLALIAALAAFLTGPSAAAVRARSTLQGGIGRLRGSAETAGWDTGRFGAWIYAHRRALRVGAVIAGGLVLMFSTRPTGWDVFWTALLVVLALALIEFLGRPTVPAATAPTAAGPASKVPRRTSPTPVEETGRTSPQQSQKGTEHHV